MKVRVNGPVVDRRRRIRSVAHKTDKEVPGSKDRKEKRRDTVARSRNETILVKADQDTNRIDSYREVAGAKDVLRETTSVKRTRTHLN